MKNIILLALVLIVASPAGAQEYPISGEIYLSFEPNRNVSFRDVAPGEEFQLWIITEIRTDGSVPHAGIVGVEGGITLPPEIELVETAFEAPAINVGSGFSEPGLESFVVGLGDCYTLGPRRATGVLTLRLAVDGEDLEIGVAAPSVGASAVSSFAGIGPGWARQDCMDGGPMELVLFGETTLAPALVTINSTTVPVGGTGITRIKSLFR